MIRISKLTDYGIILLARFVTKTDSPMISKKTGRPILNARDLADETRIPFPTVGKILKCFSRAELLVSHRGVKGGYELSRNAGEISVVQMIEALEGPVAITECSMVDHHNCELGLGCPVRENWLKINAVMLDSLRKLSLEDLAQPLREKAGYSTSRAAPAVESLADCCLP